MTHKLSVWNDGAVGCWLWGVLRSGGGCYCTVMWGRGDATCRPTTVTWRGAFKMTWRAFLFLIAYRHLALTTALSLASIKLWNKRACLHRIASEGLAEVISDTCGPQPLYSEHGQPATECRSLTTKTVLEEIKCGTECVIICFVFLFAISSPPLFFFFPNLCTLGPFRSLLLYHYFSWFILLLLIFISYVLPPLVFLFSSYDPFHPLLCSSLSLFCFSSSCSLFSPSLIPFSLPSCICFFCVTFFLNTLYMYLYLPIFVIQLHIFRMLFFHHRLLLSMPLLFMFAFFLPLPSLAA